MREQFSVDIGRDLLRDLEAISTATGVSLEDLVQEALVDLVSKRRSDRFKDHHRTSIEKFGPLYERLAK